MEVLFEAGWGWRSPAGAPCATVRSAVESAIDTLCRGLAAGPDLWFAFDLDVGRQPLFAVWARGSEPPTSPEALAPKKPPLRLVQMGLAVTPETIDHVARLAQVYGATKRSIVETAIREYSLSDARMPPT